MHEVGFAETNTTVNKQRVIRLSRILTNLACRRARELIALSLDKARKSEQGIQARNESR